MSSVYRVEGISSKGYVQLPHNRVTQEKMFDQMLNKLLNMSSEEWEYLLDNLDYVPTFRVYWLNYRENYAPCYPKPKDL